jgi:Zn-finger nucleic acid-binding protein
MNLFCPNCNVELEYHPESFIKCPEMFTCPSCGCVFKEENQ